jgi:hypothetical protein
MIETALKFIAKGHPVFPCGKDKRPMTPNGFKDASTESAVISDWWTRYPQANIGMPTGQRSGIVVLDVDFDPARGIDGNKPLKKLLEQHGPFPNTLIVTTPRGGKHYYFLYPGQKITCSAGKLGAGLDVRGDGGYVLLPPSETDRGIYAYEQKVEMAEMPQWLINLTQVTESRPQTVPRGRKFVNGFGPVDELRVREALWMIPASIEHDDWVRVGMALHSWDDGPGKNLWLEWSRTCPEKFNESDFETAWRSFKAGGGVTLGTLFELARRFGWRPQNRNKRDADGEDEHCEMDFSIPEWPDLLRPEGLHGPLGEFVRRLAPHTEADPVAILVQLLVGFGNLLGRTAHFVVESDRHYLNLNAVVVGNSSKARKGTSWGHVKRLLMLIDPTWPSPITGLSTGEGLIHQVRDPVTKTDGDGNEVVVDEGQSDKRLLAIETEFGRLLQCAGRDSNTISAVIRQAFDTGDLRVATKSSPERSTGAHICIIGHITSIELNLLLTQSDCANGLANRFLWCASKRSKLLPEGGDVDSVNFSDLVNQFRGAIEFGRRVGRVRLDEAARETWRGIYEALSSEQPGLLGAVCSRGEALVLRMATLFAVIDCSPTVTVPHLKAALAVWDYCAGSAKFIFGSTLGNPIAEKVKAALDSVGDRGVPLSGLYDHFNGHIDKDELHNALKQLQAQGLARFEKLKTSGRPSQIWFAARISGEESEKSAAPRRTSAACSVDPAGELNLLNSLNSPPPFWEVEL